MGHALHFHNFVNVCNVDLMTNKWLQVLFSTYRNDYQQFWDHRYKNNSSWDLCFNNIYIYIYIYKTELTKEQHKFYKMSFWNKKYLNGMEINIQVSFLGKRGKV